MTLRYRERLFVDECGDELADEHAVLGHALDMARDLIALARIDTIRNWRGCSGKAQAEPAGLSSGAQLAHEVAALRQFAFVAGRHQQVSPALASVGTRQAEVG